MKYGHVFLACAGAAIVAAAPLINNEDASLVTRSDSSGSSSVRRALDSDDTLVLREPSLANDGDALLHARGLDLLVRAFDEQLAARSVEHADEIAQRDLAGLERRLFFHHLRTMITMHRAKEAEEDAQKSTAKAESKREKAKRLRFEASDRQTPNSEESS